MNNLWSAVAPDWHANGNTVALVTAGEALAIRIGVWLLAKEVEMFSRTKHGHETTHIDYARGNCWVKSRLRREALRALPLPGKSSP